MTDNDETIELDLSGTDVEDLFSEETWRKARQAIAENRVEDMVLMFEEERYNFEVLGSNGDTYEVVVHLEDGEPTYLSCDCPNGSSKYRPTCYHSAAGLVRALRT